MSTRLSAESQHDRESSPLLGANGTNPRHRDLPMWRDILENKMTWGWYSTIAATGAVSLLLYDLPYRLHRLWVLGSVLYIISLIGFVLLLLIHAARFLVRPSLLPESLSHPNEGLYVPTFPTALGVLILNGATYSRKMNMIHGPSLRGAFWLYAIVSLIFSVASPLAEYSRAALHRETKNLTPLAVQLSIPLTLAGPLAAAIVSHIDPTQHHGSALAIMAFGTALQGIGAMLSLLYLSNVIQRMHNHGFPPPANRLSMFTSVAPLALTALAAVRLAEQSLRHLPADKTAPNGATDIVGGVSLYYMGIALGLAFWGMAFWFFLISMFANLACIGQLNIVNQQMQLFDLIFPHAAFTLASIELLKVFKYPRGLTILAEIIGVATIVVYALVLLSAVFGITSGRLLRNRQD